MVKVWGVNKFRCEDRTISEYNTWKSLWEQRRLECCIHTVKSHLLNNNNKDVLSKNLWLDFSFFFCRGVSASISSFFDYMEMKLPWWRKSDFTCTLYTVCQCAIRSRINSSPTWIIPILFFFLFTFHTFTS